MHSINLIELTVYLPHCIKVLIRSHLKKRVLVQVQGGAELQPAGILQYSEELKQGTNTEIGPKNFFEIASKLLVMLSAKCGTLSESER